LPLQVSNDLEHLCFDVHATIGDDLSMSFACNLPKLASDGRITDNAQERHKDLIESRFESGIHEGVDRMFLPIVSKSVQQELVAETERLLRIRGRQVDRDVAPETALAGLLGDEAAFQCTILIESSCGHELGAKYLEGARVELAVRETSVRNTGIPLTLPLLRIFTMSALSSLRPKSPSSIRRVPRKLSRIWKIGDTVEAPLANTGL
jgi:hypothetical protein